MRCSEYDPAAVEAAVRGTVALLGGIERFVRPGQRVLIKPNLLLPSHPDRAIVTHPTVVRAAVRLVQEAGGRVLIADNPGSPLTRFAWQRAYEQMGLAAVAAETGAELNEHIGHRQVLHPGGHLLHMVDTSDFVCECDAVISLPKLKTHGLMRLTGAVKNLFGTVPGMTKFAYHAKLRTVDQFAGMLLDVVSFVRPVLTIVDAVMGMDGGGPSAGDPFRLGAILAGTDPVAVDVAAVELIGHSPASIPTVAAAQARGWTTGRVEDLALLGDSLAEFRVNTFRLPPGGRSDIASLPQFLRRWGARQMVPNPVVTERCVGCGICVTNCPAQTIERADGRARIRPSGCIYCYCCHELCPEQAIDLRHPLLAQVLDRL